MTAPSYVKVSAHAANESRQYTETRIAELEHALNRMQHRQETFARQHLSQRLAVHLVGAFVALFATLYTLGLAIPLEAKLALPFVPSIVLEIVDKFLRF